MTRKARLLFAALSSVLLVTHGKAHGQESFTVESPDGRLSVTVTVGKVLSYQLYSDAFPISDPSPLSMTLADGDVWGPMAGSPRVSRGSVDESIRPVVPEKRGEIRDAYHFLELAFDGGWGLEFRAYDDGMAYRFRTNRDGDFRVQSEEFALLLPGDPGTWFPREDGFLTHSERLYERLRLSAIEVGAMASLPTLIDLEASGKLLVTEADLRSYPGLYLEGRGGGGFSGTFPAFPATMEQVRDRTVRVTSREDYLARVTGPRTFPWRVFVLARDDTDLVESTMVYRLSPLNRIQDPSWIRPGKVAWDWWNASSLHGVDFESGLNTETYLHFIDFAADHGIEYIILDEGWSDTKDFSALNPDMDLRVLLDHGASRGVGLILWVVWKTLDDDLDATLDRFASLGVAGVKVDFMQRDDQLMVDYYWRVAKAAADRQLLVDFHGSYKPAGLRRAFPNVLTREGVQGLEQSKWSARPTPTHNVTLPYIRMVAGPMDYTPGAMRNAHENRFSAVFDRPMSLGTRVHQMAMYVVFESPLQMLADSPSNYLDEPECLAFIAGVPTVWDETHVLSGEVGEWIAVARRQGNTWWVGAMGNESARDIPIDLRFLGEGEWSMEAFSDGLNAHRNAEDFAILRQTVTSQDEFGISLAGGGGWAAVFRPSG